MPNLTVDTMKLKSDGSKILELADEYNNLINNMFDDINNSVKNSWSGISAENYLRNLKNEKEFFEKMTIYLKNYGNELVRQSNDIELRIKKWERE